MVVSTYYIFAYVIAIITEVYPGSIKTPASVIAITAVAALKGLLHLILHRLSDVPKQYYTFVVWLLWAMAIIETFFKAGELLLIIAKWIPNSEINTTLDKWNFEQRAMKLLIHIWTAMDLCYTDVPVLHPMARLSLNFFYQARLSSIVVSAGAYDLPVTISTFVEKRA